MALPFFMEPIHIVGSGSIGLFLATSIRSAFPSYPLAVLFRQHHKQRIGNEKEITVCLRQKQQRPRMARVPAQIIDDRRSTSSIRNLVISTKAFQAVDAVESIVPRLDPENLRIMLLCNGALDVREKLLEILSLHEIKSPQLVMCTTTHGVEQEPPDEDMFHLVQTEMGRTFMGANLENMDEIRRLSELWDRASLNAKAIEKSKMEAFLWQKLAANCVCNPLTALYQCTNGALAKHSDFVATRDKVIQEISDVGRELNPDMAEQLSPSALTAFVELVIQENLQNTSSMFRDIEKKQETEIDNLNGYVIRKGQHLGIDCPANEELYHKIREMTATF